MFHFFIENTILLKKISAKKLKRRNLCYYVPFQIKRINYRIIDDFKIIKQIHHYMVLIVKKSLLN